MNYSIPMFPLNVTSVRGDLPLSCFVESKNMYSLECIHQTICSQFNEYFIRTGLILLISYVIASWVLWWFFHHGYKRVPIELYEEGTLFKKVIGDLRLLQNRVYWDIAIRGIFYKLMFVFIVIVVYLSWGFK